jgi:hypothetical protein
MKQKPLNFMSPTRTDAVHSLGPALVDQLLGAEKDLQGPGQFKAKQEIIARFEEHEPDLFPFFRKQVVSPYQFLVKVQKAFENQTDVTVGDFIITKRDAVDMLKRYIPNLQYLHDRQLYTTADSFKELGASVAIGVVVAGLTEAVGRNFVSNPYLSMEMAVFEVSGIALLAFLYFAGTRNRNLFHKAPWNSAVYMGANLNETNPDNWETVTWKHLQKPFRPLEGFTLFKSRPHYEAMDAAFRNAYDSASRSG